MKKLVICLLETPASVTAKIASNGMINIKLYRTNKQNASELPRFTMMAIVGR